MPVEQLVLAQFRHPAEIPAVAATAVQGVALAEVPGASQGLMLVPMILEPLEIMAQFIAQLFQMQLWSVLLEAGVVEQLAVVMATLASRAALDAAIAAARVVI
jgi:hypothetical protein